MSPRVSKEHLEQRRADILEAAKQVFIEQGYERTTMKHVMDAANVSRGGLYQYFANKEDLFESLLENNISSTSKDNQEKLDEKVESYWDLLLLRIFGEEREPDDKIDPLAPSHLEFFITGRNDERRRQYGQNRYYQGLKIYADVLRAGQESGEFSSQYDCEILARTIISFIDGLALDDAILPKQDSKIKEQSVLFVTYLKTALGVSSQ